MQTSFAALCLPPHHHGLLPFLSILPLKHFDRVLLFRDCLDRRGLEGFPNFICGRAGEDGCYVGQDNREECEVWKENIQRHVGWLQKQLGSDGSGLDEVCSVACLSKFVPPFLSMFIILC